MDNPAVLQAKVSFSWIYIHTLLHQYRLIMADIVYIFHSRTDKKYVLQEVSIQIAREHGSVIKN